MQQGIYYRKVWKQEDIHCLQDDLFSLNLQCCMVGLWDLYCLVNPYYPWYYYSPDWGMNHCRNQLQYQIIYKTTMHVYVCVSVHARTCVCVCVCVVCMYMSPCVRCVNMNTYKHSLF